MIISFHPSPVLEDTSGWSRRRAGAVLSAAFTWLREKLWAPPVVADPKRNHGPAGQLCRQWHGDKTRNSVVKRWWQTLRPEPPWPQEGFVYSCFGSWWLIDNGPENHMACLYLNILLQLFLQLFTFLFHGTWTYMRALAHWCKGSHPFESLHGASIHSYCRYRL